MSKGHTSPRSIARKRPRVSVLIPAYNHEHYVAEAIASVLAQDWPEIELLVLDDGSTDSTLDAAARAIRGERRVRCALASQANAGVCVTLNRLMSAATGDILAILNSDDRFAPTRLTKIIAAAGTAPRFFGFSAVRCFESGRTDDFERFRGWYADALRMAGAVPTAGYALLLANFSISSSNFVFSRELVEKSGGFDPALPLTQDWDFILRCLPFTEPVFTPEPLLDYRVHPLNTWRNHKATHMAQSLAVLRSYFEGKPTSENPMAPTAGAWRRYLPMFLAMARQPGSDDSLAHFLRQQGIAPEPVLSVPSVDNSVESRAIASLVALAATGPCQRADPARLAASVSERWSTTRQAFAR